MDSNLPDLRDIHLPSEAVSVWPLAYGWWVILLTIISILLLVWLTMFLRRKSKKIYALKILSSLRANNRDSIIKMSEILRRICVYKYPQATSLFGQQWIDFLNLHCSHKISGSVADLLISAPYMKATSFINTKDITKLRDFCSSWVGENL